MWSLSMQPKAHLYLKVSHKERKNKVVSGNASSQLIENAMGEDVVSSCKAGGYFATTATLVKASSELQKSIGSAANTLLKMKFFARLQRPVFENLFLGNFTL